MPSFANYKYYVDWDNDGNFTGPYDDISAYVLGAVCSEGFDSTSHLTGRVTSGQATLQLNNHSGMFSSYNSNSPIYGKVLPSRQMKITMKIGVGAEVTLWGGYLKAIKPKPGNPKTEARAELTANGVLFPLDKRKINIPMCESKKTGSAFNDVLDAGGVPSGAQYRSVDAGQTTMSRWWSSDEVSVFQALRDLEETECGRMWENRGVIFYGDRSHAANTPRCANEQAIYANTPGTGKIHIRIEDQEDPAAGIYNVIKANVRTFNKSEEGIRLWVYVDIVADEGGAPFVIPHGQTVKIEAKFPSKNTDTNYIAVAVWDMLNVAAYENDDGTGTDLTSFIGVVQTKTSCSNVIELTNNHSSMDAWICQLSADGQAIVEGDDSQVSQKDQQSIDDFGEKTYVLPGKYIEDINEGQGFCDHLVEMFKNPIPALAVSYEANKDLDHLTEAQTRWIFDRIRMQADADSTLYIDDPFYVDWIQHTIQGNKHTVSMKVSAVSAHDWGPSEVFYTPRIIPKPITTGVSKVPDDLWSTGWYANGKIYLTVAAWKNNATIFNGELRAKWYPTSFQGSVDLRTAAEGGADFDPYTDVLVTDLGADSAGVTFRFAAGDVKGRWYYAFRLQNDVGWSVWTDGNETPCVVPDFVDMEAQTSGLDIGPPADWEVWLTPGPRPDTYIPHASRPKTYGHKICRIGFQLRDVTVPYNPTFDQLDDGINDSVVYYDGSLEDHIYNALTGEIKRADLSGGGWGMISQYDILMYDVRNDGSNFDIDHCDGELVESFTDDTIKLNARPLLPGDADVGEGTNEPIWQHVRIKICKPWWKWGTNGYLGDTGTGWWAVSFEMQAGGGDFTTEEFVGEALQVPTGTDVNKLAVRAWFLNSYSITDDRTWTIGVKGAYLNRVAIWKPLGVVSAEEGFRYQDEDWSYNHWLDIRHNWTKTGRSGQWPERNMASLFIEENLTGTEEWAYQWEGALTIQKTNEPQVGDAVSTLWDWTAIYIYLSSYYNLDAAYNQMAIRIISESAPNGSDYYYGDEDGWCVINRGLDISCENYSGNCGELVSIRVQSIYDEQDYAPESEKDVIGIEIDQNVYPYPHEGGEVNVWGGGLVVRTPWYLAEDKDLCVAYGIYIEDYRTHNLSHNPTSNSDGSQSGINFRSAGGEETVNIFDGMIGVGDFMPDNVRGRPKMPAAFLHIKKPSGSSIPEMRINQYQFKQFQSYGGYYVPVFEAV